MQLDILRHAKSSWADPGQEDHERPLNGRGERAAAAIGRHLAGRGALPEQVLCSSARRAQQTWKRVARQLPDDARDAVELVVEPDLYLASPAALLRRLRQLPPTLERAMVVGHNPGLAQLANELAEDGASGDALAALRTKYPTAGLATFEISGVWAELCPTSARLIRFLTPKDLA